MTERAKHIQAPSDQAAATAPVALGTLTAATPDALVSGASEMARTLAEVIRAQGLATRIQGREYVQVEGWTTLGVMLGVTAREVSTIEADGGVYVATVELVRMSDGAVISRASAECGDEPPWNKRPRYARRSMAQTRATGKACRLAFSWIMRLAGYEPTPAEEMPVPPDPPGAHSPSRTGSPSPALPVAPQHGRQPEASTPAAPADQPERITDAQHRRLEAEIHRLGLDRERVKAWCSRAFGVEHFPDLSHQQLSALLGRLPGWAHQIASETPAAQDGSS